MRLSKLFFTSLRDDPADAEMASHRLLLRAGYLRQLGSGIYSLLPLGFRVNQRVEHATENVGHLRPCTRVFDQIKHYHNEMPAARRADPRRGPQARSAWIGANSGCLLNCTIVAATRRR